MGCGALFVVVVAVGSVVVLERSPFVWVGAAGRSGPIRHSARRKIGLHRECVEVDVGGGWVFHCLEVVDWSEVLVLVGGGGEMRG